MKVQAIGTLVGGLLIFIWQFLSWAMLNIHGNEMQYTPNQDQILEALNQANLQDGQYFLPNVPPGASQTEEAEYMKNAVGKPWAQIIYHKSMTDTMGMNMVRALAVDLLSVWFLIWILMQFSSVDITKGIMASLAVGAIGYLTIPYLNQIWFEVSTTGYIIDTVVQWGLVGAWLGWWIGRN